MLHHREIGCLRRYYYCSVFVVYEIVHVNVLAQVGGRRQLIVAVNVVCKCGVSDSFIIFHYQLRYYKDYIIYAYMYGAVLVPCPLILSD